MFYSYRSENTVQVWDLRAFKEFVNILHLHLRAGLHPVWPKNSCGATVELEQAAKPFATANCGGLTCTCNRTGGEQQQIDLSLMVAFLVKVLEIIADRTLQRVLPEQN
jgi:hypothetical protein